MIEPLYEREAIAISIPLTLDFHSNPPHYLK
jgi:hypothetical protein